MNNETNFLLPKDGYLAFDALTMKQFIKDRLNDTGVFTDQNYEGSYISTVNEIVAYTFNVLMYYLNRTSTETMFSESVIYENMNRIVKLLDYKPIGKQTASLTFTMDLDPYMKQGLYTIPRYAFIEMGSHTYSFNEDITFNKKTPVGVGQSMEDVSKHRLLFQGKFIEYPKIKAIGNDNEIVFFSPGKSIKVDHFNIHVYVKRAGIWEQWNSVPSLYLEDAFSKSFEVRLNESKIYELKFGNGISGKKLNVGDELMIYYLRSDGTDGEVSEHTLLGSTIVPYTSKTMDEIKLDLEKITGEHKNYIGSSDAKHIIFDNENNSTYFQHEETVEDVKDNAPGIFRSQYRLVTEEDYMHYVSTNFANLLHDVQVVNNWKYVNEHMKYFYDIGLKNPNNVSNLLYNQLQFADSCNFNNVYIVAVPKTVSNTKNPTSSLSPAQKDLMISSIRSVKSLTSETIIIDPVYIAFGVCVASDGSANATLDDVEQSEMFVEKLSNSRRDSGSIINDITNIIQTFFSRENVTLGAEFDINVLSNKILSVDGVKTFYIRRKDDHSIKYNGLSMLMWNPIYPNDRSIVTKNTPLEYFKYIYLDNSDKFSDKIVVEAETKIHEMVEF